jgi:hypothetical protein
MPEFDSPSSVGIADVSKAFSGSSVRQPFYTLWRILWAQEMLAIGMSGDLHEAIVFGMAIF